MRCAVREPKRPSDFLGQILKGARTVATHSDTERVLGSVLGLGEDEVARLREEGVVG